MVKMRGADFGLDDYWPLVGRLARELHAAFQFAPDAQRPAPCAAPGGVALTGWLAETVKRASRAKQDPSFVTSMAKASIG